MYQAEWPGLVSVNSIHWLRAIVGTLTTARSLPDVRGVGTASARDLGHWTLVMARRIHESVTVRLEITRRAELAIRALALLTESPQRVKASALAEVLGTTVKFVPQVLGPLVRAGWVQSDPGPTGGYRSRVDVGDVSVLQVIEAVDGVTDIGRCVVADRPCQSANPCVLHVAWAQARTELVRVLQSTPVSAAKRVVA